MNTVTSRGRARVLRALVSFRATAKATGADLEFLDAFDEVMSQIDSSPKKLRTPDPLLQANRVITLSPQAVERIVTRNETSRKQLEAIAVNRFEIPKGSLRSWGTVEQLREKVLSMARNEQAHQTIARVAQRSGREAAKKP